MVKVYLLVKRSSMMLYGISGDKERKERAEIRNSIIFTVREFSIYFCWQEFLKIDRLDGKILEN